MERSRGLPSGRRYAMNRSVEGACRAHPETEGKWHPHLSHTSPIPSVREPCLSVGATSNLENLGTGSATAGLKVLVCFWNGSYRATVAGGHPWGDRRREPTPR